MRTTLGLMCCGAIGALSAGSTCCSNRDERPPWERHAAKVDARAEVHAADAGAPPRFDPVEAQVELADRRSSVRAGSAEVPVGGAARAWLEGDMDGDGDQDLLVLVERDPLEGSVARSLDLATFERDGTELRSAGAASVGGELADRCALETARLRLVAPQTFTLSAAIRCPTVRSTFAAVGSVWPSTRVRLSAKTDGLLELDAQAAAVGVEMNAEDRDGDGHTDALLTVSVPSGRAKLAYSERAAGYGLVAGSIESSLAEVLPAPRSRIDGDERLRKARAVIALRRLTCEGEIRGVRLTIDGRPPRECQASRAVGRAITELIRASLAGGDVPSAREALGLLELPGVALGEQARSTLEQSVAQHMTLRLEHAYTRGPALSLALGAPVRNPLRFQGDDRVLVAGAEPRAFSVSSLESEPADPTEDRVLSPDGRLMVWTVERGCAGHRATLCAVDTDCASAPPTLAVEIAGRGLGAEFPGCDGATRAQIAEPALPDIAVLAWRAPGGLLVQDGHTLREVRVSDSGRPAGTPRLVSVPTELPPGSAFGAGGRRQVIGRADGLWVRDSEEWALIPAAQVAGDWSDALAIALSPSGMVVAAVRSGHLDIVQFRAVEGAPRGP